MPTRPATSCIHDMPDDAVRRVWSSIALHTTHGIPQFMEPEIALLAAGVRLDVDGAGLNLLDPAAIEEITAVHPRHDFKRQALKPSPKGSKTGPTPLRHDHSGHARALLTRVQAQGLRRVVRNNAWPD